MKGSVWAERLLDPTEMTRDKVRAVEETIANDLKCDPFWVFLSIESEKNPLYRPPGWNQDPGDIIIVREGLEPERFQNLSDLWRESSTSKFLYVSLFTHRDEESAAKFEGFGREDWANYLLERLSDELDK